MTLDRRAFVRLMALLGITPAAANLGGCSDDASSSDADGNDASSDAAADAADAGADAADAEPEIEVPDDLPEYDYDGELGPEALFAAGVASGDPLKDAVILWTYVETDDDAPVEVWWEIALDPAFTQRLQVGTATAEASHGHTVKVDVGALYPGRTYYYRFFALGRPSPVGRTRTAPEGSVDQLRFAVCACSSFTSGYFHAYASIARQADLDAVLHLGDYIYEGGGSYLQLVDDRVHTPDKTIETIDEYRERYRQYRGDLQLQEVHRQHPFIHVWDDHESKNNSWRDGADGFDGTAEEWGVRKRTAFQAMMEWLPIREQARDLQIWRHLPYGDLADLVMLDTRIWDRDEQAGGVGAFTPDPEASILGDEQAAWLDERMCESTATWKVIGQQVMMAHFQINGAPLNPDQWDGYPGSRRRFLETLDRCGVDNVVVLTGDIHTSWANEVTLDPLDPEVYDPETSEGALAVEYVCTSITSQGGDAIGNLGPFLENATDIVLTDNPHMRWLDLTRKGYVLLDLTPERAQGAWVHFEDVRVRDEALAGEFFATAWSCEAGRTQLIEDSELAPGKPDPPALAP